MAELSAHGATRANTIQYTLNNAKLLDFRGPLGSLLTKTNLSPVLGNAAKGLGYEGILFNSVRYSHGTNSVLFKNFDSLLKGGRIIF